MRRTMAIGAAIATFALPALAASDGQEALRLDQIQVVGTHNSYQLPADPRVMPLMLPRLKPMLDMMNNLPPEQLAAMREEHPHDLANSFGASLDYIQMPIEAQLRAGVRSLELDLQADPEGGRYADPLPYRELKAKGETDLAPIHESELRQPGMKVFHMSDIDFRSQCPRLRQCLGLLRQWSDANPGHSPVFILLEPKLNAGLSGAVPGATPVAPFDRAAFDEVDAAILAVLGRDRLVTPDDVRGSHPTLEAAALAHGWPTLAASRGKFLFLYLVPGLNLKAFAPYLDGHASLEKRVAFVQGLPGMAHTAFLLIDNATAKPGRIEELVRKGYLVRSRADIDTFEARENDARRRDATLASGAQIVSTDYPLGPNIHGNGYQVAPFAGGVRCNPVTAACGQRIKLDAIGVGISRSPAPGQR